MHVSTLIKYLLGDRQSIIEAASCRQAVWLGLLFVISAGFAREYDGEDLLHEPWHLALPLGASLLTSLLLFGLLELAFSLVSEHGGRQFWEKYRAFLGLYWMTAPLAWLYAVPVERFLGPADAVRANLWLLGIVAAWRVALMTRVVSVVYGRSATAAFFVVMLFADSVAIAVVCLTPLPIVSVMGGIRLTDSEQVLQATAFFVSFLGVVSWLLWLGGAVVAALRSRKTGAGWDAVDLAAPSPPAVGRGLWALAAGAILIWAAMLPFTQDEQLNRRRVESDLRAGRIEEAIQYMSQRSRDDFPPHWDPPPRIGYGDAEPSIIDVLLQLNRSGGAPWVQQLYREKLALQGRASHDYYGGHAILLNDMDDEELASYAKLLQSLPEGPAMARYHESEVKAAFDYEERGFQPPSDRRRASLEAILSLIPKGDSKPVQNPP